MSMTMLIPLFMIKERSTLDKDVEEYNKSADATEEDKEEYVGVLESLKYVVKNKSFMIWMAVYFALEFSTQMFLTGQNVLYSGYMGFEGFKITVIMACAFAPVPLTLVLYNRIVGKHGIRAGYIFSLSAYLLAMVATILCSQSIIPNETVRLIVAAVGGVLSAFGTGCFFSINYTIPSTLADNERKKTGISHPAMYFAVQGLVGGVSAAISTGLVWVNLKNIDGGNFVWLMPVIVIVGGLVSMALTKLMTKDVTDIGKTEEKE
jgi:Na+/melibiose symporter-like transporter